MNTTTTTAPRSFPFQLPAVHHKEFPVKSMKKAFKSLFNPDAPSFVDSAARLSAALAEHEQVTRRYEYVLNHERPAADAVREADNALRGLQEPDDPTDARSRRRWHEAQGAKVRAIEERERLGEEVCRLRQRLGELAEEIETLRAGGTVNELRAYQDECETLRAELVRIDGLIAAQQAIVAGAGVDTTALDALRAQRPALLADIAEGEDRAADLAALDADIGRLPPRSRSRAPLPRQPSPMPSTPSPACPRAGPRSPVGSRCSMPRRRSGAASTC